jgi:hypothetical protein
MRGASGPCQMAAGQISVIRRPSFAMKWFSSAALTGRVYAFEHCCWSLDASSRKRVSGDSAMYCHAWDFVEMGRTKETEKVSSNLRTPRLRPTPLPRVVTLLRWRHDT